MVVNLFLDSFSRFTCARQTLWRHQKGSSLFSHSTTSEKWSSSSRCGKEPPNKKGNLFLHLFNFGHTPVWEEARLFHPFQVYFLMPHLHETAKISPIFAVRQIFVSIRQMDITLHKIELRDRKIPISKIGRTAWQNIHILCIDMGQASPLEDLRLKCLITLCKVMLRYLNDWMTYSLIAPFEPVILFMGLFNCYLPN